MPTLLTLESGLEPAEVQVMGAKARSKELM
jgi:hypothetical protein